MKNDTITIKIKQEDLKILKDAGYQLCMAGRMKDTDFTVVWYATGSFGSNNQIKVLDEYEVFASNGCGEKVFVDFPGVTAGIGEECVIDKYGIISQPKTGRISDAIVLINDYGNLHPGLIQKGKGIKGEELCNPLFLSWNLILPGEFEFFPAYEMKIWFAQNTQTGEILPKEAKWSLRAAKTKQIVVDLEKKDSPVLEYSDGFWKYI